MRGEPPAELSSNYPQEDFDAAMIGAKDIPQTDDPKTAGRPTLLRPGSLSVAASNGLTIAPAPIHHDEDERKEVDRMDMKSNHYTKMDVKPNPTTTWGSEYAARTPLAAPSGTPVVNSALATPSEHHTQTLEKQPAPAIPPRLSIQRPVQANVIVQ